MSDKRPVLRAGSLAYWDTLKGLVACRVDEIRSSSVYTGGPPSSCHTVFFTVTATKHPIYKRGEKHQAFALHVAPREAVSHRRLGARITYYTVELMGEQS